MQELTFSRIVRGDINTIWFSKNNQILFCVDSQKRTGTRLTRVNRLICVCVPCKKGVKSLKVSHKGLFWDPFYFLCNICYNIPNARHHLYAYDTAIYCCALQALKYLQSVFDIVQIRLCQLKLVNNTDKSK